MRRCADTVGEGASAGGHVGDPARVCKRGNGCVGEVGVKKW